MPLDLGRHQLADRCGIRVLKMIDDFNREALDIEGEFSLPSGRLTCTLKQIIDRRGKPSAIRCDKGSEYLSATIVQWVAACGASSSNTSSLASRSRTPMSSDSTGPLATNGSSNTTGRGGRATYEEPIQDMGAVTADDPKRKQTTVNEAQLNHHSTRPFAELGVPD